MRSPVSTRYRKLLSLAFVLVALGMIAVACGAEAPTGDCLSPEDGQLVPSDCEVEGVTPNPTATPTPTTSGGNGGDPAIALLNQYTCNGCHTIQGTSLQGKVGPDLTDIGTESEDYIRESIVDPSAVIASDCPGGPCADIMPKTFGNAIPPEDLDAIVEYLASLE